MAVSACVRERLLGGISELGLQVRVMEAEAEKFFLESTDRCPASGEKEVIDSAWEASR